MQIEQCPKLLCLAKGPKDPTQAGDKYSPVPGVITGPAASPKLKCGACCFLRSFLGWRKDLYFLKISKKPSVRARNRYDLCIWLLALLILLTAFRAVCLVFPSPSLFIKERWLDLLVVEIPGSHHLDTPQRFRLQQTNERKTSVFIQAF